MNEIIRKIDEEIVLTNEEGNKFLKILANSILPKGSIGESLNGGIMYVINQVSAMPTKPPIQAEQKEPKTNGDRIREMNNEELANWIFEKIESTEWDKHGGSNYEDDIAEWLDEVVSENN